MNFTERHSKGIKSLLSKTELQQLEERQAVNFIHPEYGSFPVSLDLLEDMKSHEIDLERGIDVTCPVRIFHGCLVSFSYLINLFFVISYL